MKTLISAAILSISLLAFAGPAVTYDCLGKDSLTNQAVAFELVFADHDSRAGYTDQSIVVSRVGGENLAQPIVFQQFRATKKNTCTKNQNGEILLLTDLNMTPTPQGDIAAYTVNVKSDCAQLKLDVRAYCLFQY